jgi:glutathione S-transferase
VRYELIDVDAQFDLARFGKISPFGRVPVMEVDGTAITESMAMVEFLEEFAPEPPLNYSGAVERAKVREICEAVNSSIHPVQNSSVVSYFLPGLAKAQMRPVRAIWIANNLVKLQPRLWRTSFFAVGDRFTLADIFVAVMYRKGVALGMLPEDHPPFEAHCTFLLSQPEIRDSSPLLPYG